MKYFKVKNDIIKTDNENNPCWTDEPLWLRNEIDGWKSRYGEDIGGGRFFATEDARYSYIISPNDDLMDLSNDDLEELTEEEIIDIISIAFPEGRIEREGEPDEWIPTPSLETVCSTYWHYATNHTGTISADETWTVANNEHHITGSITLAANTVVTVDPGAIVKFDGNYTIILQAGTTGTTTFSCVGTSASRIIFESNAYTLGTGVNNGITNFGNWANNNTKYAFSYCDISGFTNGFNTLASPTGTAAFVFSYNKVQDFGGTVIIGSGSAATNATFNNNRFLRCSAISYNGPSTATATVTVNDNEFINCASVFNCGAVGSLLVTNWNDNMYVDSNTSLVQNTYTNNRGLIIGGNAYAQTATNTLPYAFNNCISARRIQVDFSSSSTATNTTTFTNCDILNTFANTNYALTNAAAGATYNVTSCFISGHRNADFNNYYTGSETPAQISNSGTMTFATGRTTRNYTFAPASISSAGTVGTTVNITWNSGFRTMNRVRYGTSTGNYTRVVSAGGSWSNWDGKGQFTTTPSISFTGVASTTYYYVCESYDWAYDIWVSSAEQTVSVAGEVAPTFAGITGLENIGFGGLLVSWSAATGNKTNYNVYVKIGSAPTFSEKPIKVDTTYTSFKITHLADGTRIQDTDNVYVSVRAENTPTLIDTNTAVLNLYPVGSGSTGVIVGDTVAIALKQ